MIMFHDHFVILSFWTFMYCNVSCLCPLNFNSKTCHKKFHLQVVTFFLKVLPFKLMFQNHGPMLLTHSNSTYSIPEFHKSIWAVHSLLLRNFQHISLLFGVQAQTVYKTKLLVPVDNTPFHFKYYMKKYRRMFMNISICSYTFRVQIRNPLLLFTQKMLWPAMVCYATKSTL